MLDFYVGADPAVAEIALYVAGTRHGQVHPAYAVMSVFIETGVAECCWCQGSIYHNRLPFQVPPVHGFKVSQLFYWRGNDRTFVVHDAPRQFQKDLRLG